MLKDPEGPALGDYYTNVTSSTTYTENENVSFSHLSGQRETSSFLLSRTAGNPLPFGNLLNFGRKLSLLHQITALRGGFILTMNICRYILTLSLALPTWAGLIYLLVCQTDHPHLK